MKNIVILGGGSSGWMTALFCERFFPDHKITVIEDSKTGIIGVGESTTPSLIDLLDFIGISVPDLIKNCNATIKNGVKFTNWNNDGKSYVNGFNPIPELDIFSTSSKNYYTNQPIAWPSHKSMSALLEMQQGNNLDDIHFNAILANLGKIPIDKISKEQYASFALHFDAREFANYLKKTGLERNIQLVDGLVVQSNLYEDGFVKSIVLEDTRVIDCDFVFDCSGFARIFVEKTYNSKFNSFKDFLPVKKAIPFFIENKKSTPSFTEAISMEAGWLWKTPVGNRFGCGYVFDSDYITDDQAYNEVCDVIGEKININKVISFESGYFDTPWNKNTLAIGLSSGFLEPLEATSIWITVISLHLLIEHISGVVHKDERAIQEYNISFKNKIDSIMSLVRLHYHTRRTDTNFWKEFFYKNKTPTLLEEILDIYSHRLPSLLESSKYNAFPAHSWYNVSAGNNIFSKHIINKECAAYNINKFSNENFKELLKKYSDQCYDHDTYLKEIRKNK
jgi:tryptophan halogenase